ncbi:MAG TPA: hypothetical protein VF651_03995 [Gammaproteobacteria bacterium]
MQGRISRRAAAFAVAGLVLAVAPSWAADDVWVVAGQPSGGQVFKVVVDPTDPDTLYAMANPGVFKSTDGGAHWSLTFSMNDADGIDLAVDSVQPANVYVAGHDSGLWKSDDGGESWSHLGGITKAHVVAVDPVNEGVVYTIANDDFVNGCNVYKSVDGGESWNLIDTGMSGLTGNAKAWCTRIAIDPADPQVLYLSSQVGDYDGSIGARDGDALSGLYSSTDGGAHWTQHLPTLAFADVVVDPSDDQNVYAGSYVSNDAGATWAPINTPAANFTVIAVDPSDSQVILGVEDATITGVLWMSRDQGAHWDPVAMPHGNAVYNLAYDPVTPATVYASSQAFGVYKSTDGGSTWAESTEGLAGVYAFNVLMDSTGDIYLGSIGTGIFKSTDGGATWAMKDDGLDIGIGSSGITTRSLVEAATPGTLYMTNQSHLYKTTNGGDTWSRITSRSDGSIDIVATDPERADTVYAGTGGGHVLKSTDGGAHWTQSVSGLPADGVWSLAVDPTDSDVLYIGGFQSSLSKSTDGGKTWSLSDTGLAGSEGVWCVAVDPKDGDNVYACAGNHGVYKSTDGGKKWAKAGDVPDYAFSILEVDPHDPVVIYAALPGFAVYVSTDSGAHWTKLVDPSGSAATASRTEAMAASGSSHTVSASSGSQYVKISAFAVDPRSEKVYGAASDHQVYVYSNSHLPSGSGSSGSGGGGGGFPLLASLALLGVGFLRRRS